MKPRFSIIIPAYNEEKCIRKTLESIPKSKEVETIVICNACTDETESIAGRYSKIISIKEKNVSKARNIGAQNSKGEILIFLDADTLLTENVLKEINLKLKSSVIGTCRVKPNPGKLKYKIAMFLKNFFLWFPWTTGIIYCTKDVYKKINGFDESKTKKEDSDFVKKAKLHGRFSIANAYVINSMRRFEALGLIKVSLYWIKETLKPTKKEYKSIR
ncbi:glycosyltransferase [Candidatus Woesearchaeota archaeon]|nr:glycosyltransferase [Candidatus Woesearchaeota archaeon]